MTSSLVGSEMCIRDRATGAPTSSRPRQMLETWWSGCVEKLGAVPFCFSICLLYTSDAADDM
eukprot:5430613-Prorocentrum_lima.AAC.1